MFVLWWLLSDTELPKDVSQKIISGNLTGDFSQVVEGTPDVHGHKVIGDLTINTIDDIL